MPASEYRGSQEALSVRGAARKGRDAAGGAVKAEGGGAL